MITYALNCANKISRSVSTGLVFNLESFQAYADNITSNRPDLDPGDLSSLSREKLKAAVDKIITLNTLIINDLNELLAEQSKLHNPYLFQLEALIQLERNFTATLTKITDSRVLQRVTHLYKLIRT